MKLFLAGCESDRYNKLIQKNGGKNRLVSFYSLGLLGNIEKWQSVRDEYKGFDTLFMDCGAYSAWTKGFEISVHEYGTFLRQFGRDIDIYPNLDVKGDLQSTKRNMQILEEEYGLHPIPVFHLITEDWDTLDEYIENYDYIALGAIAGENTGKAGLRNNLNEVFKRAKKKPLTRFHGFGLTIVSIIKKYPFYSVDSTSWLSSVRYGGISTYDNGKIKKQDGKYAKYLSKCRHHLDIAGDSVKAYLSLEKEVTELWRRRGIIFNENDYETKHKRRR